MLVSEKQLIIMLDALRGSLKIHDRLGMWNYDENTRRIFFEQIINQQSDKLVDVKIEELDEDY